MYATIELEKLLRLQNKLQFKKASFDEAIYGLGIVKHEKNKKKSQKTK